MKNNFIVRKMSILLVAIIFGTAAASAGIIQGRVLDAETHEPLYGAQVKVIEDDLEHATMARTLETDSLGCFIYKCMEISRITFRVNFFGYKPKVVNVMGAGDGDTIRIDDILLKPSDVLLKEVLVQSRQRRFYMRGDTVVFNPDAFQMKDGDRLLDLIRKLPGVSIEEGRLLWNGEPLKILMNGRDALSEDLLLNRLPVEAVADVKAYERKSEQEERTGVADGNQQQVLDVTIKPGFMDNWYGSVALSGYTSENYGAEFDGMRLSDSDPVMLFGHVGDEPKRILKHTMGSFGGESGGTAVRQQMGSAGYKHVWRPSFEVVRESYMSLTAGVNHADRPQSSWQNTHTFLPGSTPTRTNSLRNSYEHLLDVPLDFSAFINLNPKNTLFLTAHAGYERGEICNSQEQQTLESLTLNAINSSIFHSSSATTMFVGNIDGYLTFHMPKGSVDASASVSYSNTEEHGNSVGEYRYQQTASQITDHQRYEAPHRHLKVAAQLGVSHGFTKQAMLNAKWQAAYEHSFRDEQRYRADAMDYDNSFRKAADQWLNKLEANANLTLRKFTLNPSIALTHRHEQTDYSRAVLDTAAQRNLLIFRPSLELTWRIRQQMRLKGTVSYDGKTADLLDCISYTDDTNPLFIYQGNSSLTTSHVLKAGLLYNFMLTSGSQVLGFSVNYMKTCNPIGMVLHYDSQTGIYRAQKQNVRGGNGWSASLSYDRTLAKNLQFQSALSEHWNTSYGILTMVDDQTGLSYNRQQSSHMQERLGLICEAKNLTITSFHNFNWERYAYSDAAQSTENIYRYSAELNVRYHSNQWSFAIEPHFFLNRGYLSDAMNNNLFILNAEASYKFMKQRAELIFSARDILNEETDYKSSITATTHTESGKSFLHHYATLTFRYILEAKKRHTDKNKKTNL